MPAIVQLGRRELPLLTVSLLLLSLLIGVMGIATAMLSHLEQGDFSWSFRPSGLGNYLKSPLAWVYNATLIWAGLWLLLAMVALGRCRPRLPDLYLPIAGALLALTVMLMGIFPNHYDDTHGLLAVGFTLAATLNHSAALATGITGRLHFSSPLLCFLSILGLVCALPILEQTNWMSMDIQACAPSSIPCSLDVLLWLQLAIVMLWYLVLAFNIYRKALASRC